MLQYICVITNENEKLEDNFIHAVSFHQSFAGAEDHAKMIESSLKGMSDHFIYRNLSALEDDFLRLKADENLPF